MSLIKNTLEAEEQKLKKLKGSYEERLLSLPKGSLTIKKRGSKEYYYLSYRQNNKVISDYIGNDRLKVEEIAQDLQRRMHTKSMIKKLSKELALISKLKESL